MAALNRIADDYASDSESETSTSNTAVFTEDDFEVEELVRGEELTWVRGRRLSLLRPLDPKLPGKNIFDAFILKTLKDYKKNLTTDKFSITLIHPGYELTGGSFFLHPRTYAYFNGTTIINELNARLASCQGLALDEDFTMEIHLWHPKDDNEDEPKKTKKAVTRKRNRSRR